MTDSTRSTSHSPLVSVCIPTYNGGDFIRVCLESLLAQDLEDFEILIGDDGSTDDTLEIARSYDDPRVHILSFDSRAGMVKNWNRCLAEARGKYVTLVAQDDCVTPQWAGRLAGLLESHPEADLAFGRRAFEFSDETSRIALGDFFENKYAAVLEAFYERTGTVIPPEVMLDEAMQESFEINLIGEPSFTMCRRDHPATREGYHVGFRQMIDWEFTSRFFVDRPVVHCPEILGTYRIHAAGSTVGNIPMSVHYRDYSLLVEKVLERFDGRLSSAQREQLFARKAVFEKQLLEHSEFLETQTKALVIERDSLLEHTDNLEKAAGDAEASFSAQLSAQLSIELAAQASEHLTRIEAMEGHMKALLQERDGLRAHADNLEKIVSKTHAKSVYRVLSKVKGFFGSE